MSEQHNGSQKNRASNLAGPLNPVITLEMRDKLLNGGLKAVKTPPSQKIKNSSLSGAPTSSGKTYNKPTQPQIKKPGFKKPISREAAQVDGVYTKPIDPFGNK